MYATRKRKRKKQWKQTVFNDSGADLDLVRADKV